MGNTPTAPLAIVEEPEPGLRPAPVIGVPVGFVNVVESKERLLTACEACGVPAIVAMGRKNGSNVATAIWQYAGVFRRRKTGPRRQRAEIKAKNIFSHFWSNGMDSSSEILYNICK